MEHATSAIASGLGWRIARSTRRIDVCIVGPLTPSMIRFVHSALTASDAVPVRLDLSGLTLPRPGRGGAQLLAGHIRSVAARVELVAPREPTAHLFFVGVARGLGCARVLGARRVDARPGWAEDEAPALSVRSALWAEPQRAVASVGRVLGLEPRALAACLAEVGTSIRHERLEVRLGAALTMLALGDDKVSAIASATGWQSLSWFTELCRTITGSTPAEVRAIARHPIPFGAVDRLHGRQG